MTIKLIHVGLGGWGGDWARTAIPPVPEIEVAALVDPFEPTRLKVCADLGIPEELAFGSLTEALAAVEADAVLITAPAVTHVPLALEALEAGKHVLVEKPFANTAEEAAVAARRADELGLILQVSQNYRNYPAPRVVQQLLREHALGELSAINVDFRQWDNDREIGTYPHYKFPHPMINDMAIHHFDLLRMVTGEEAVRVYAKVGDPSFSKYDEEASAIITIELESGLVVSYRGSWVSRGRKTAWAGEWSIQGEDGEIFFTSRADGSDRTATGDVVTILPAGRKRPKRLPLEESPFYGRSAGLQIFARAIESGIPPETVGSANLGSLALMEAAARSAASGQVEEVLLP